MKLLSYRSLITFILSFFLVLFPVSTTVIAAAHTKLFAIDRENQIIIMKNTEEMRPPYTKDSNGEEIAGSPENWKKAEEKSIQTALRRAIALAKKNKFSFTDYSYSSLLLRKEYGSCNDAGCQMSATVLVSVFFIPSLE